MIDKDKLLEAIDPVLPELPPSELLQSIRVLFAEDSLETINIFKLVVDRLGWDSRYVGNAVEMIEAVNCILTENLTLDAVVADISFLSGPKLTGITAAREIRKALPNVPIIFISAYVTSIIREEVRRIGAEIIQKPFDVEVLFIRLSQLIYWNRLVLASEFDGPERRRNSVNRTENLRRATDYILSTPYRIAQTLRDIRETQ